jgi:excisionase family DNA binding protein
MSEKSLDQLIEDSISSAIEKNIERLAQLQLDRERFLSIPEVAQLAAVSKPTVRGWISREYMPLPAYKIGRDFKIKYKDFAGWFEQFKR